MSSDDKWFIAVARDALEEGYRVVAHHLNQVLAVVAPNVRIESLEPRDGDSLRHADALFRSALPALRVHAQLPPEDSRLRLWTYGYVNDSGNAPFDYHANDGIGMDGLVSICQMLLEGRSTWQEEHWRNWIKLPVEELQQQWLAFLASLESPATNTADNGKEFPPKHPDNPVVRDLCCLLAKRHEDIAAGKTTEIAVAREFTNGTASNDRETQNLLRQARRFRHLWKVPVSADNS